MIQRFLSIHKFLMAFQKWSTTNNRRCSWYYRFLIFSCWSYQIVFFCWIVLDLLKETDMNWICWDPPEYKAYVHKQAEPVPDRLLVTSISRTNINKCIFMYMVTAIIAQTAKTVKFARYTPPGHFMVHLCIIVLITT